MLAIAWPWSGAALDDLGNISTRLGASLCAGIGGHAGLSDENGIHCAYRALRWTAAQARSWHPARMPSGKVAIFHGYIDNAAAVAAELGADSLDPARLYALAVEAWGDQADLKIIGDYCAVIADPGGHQLRLSRSPLRARAALPFSKRGVGGGGVGAAHLLCGRRPTAAERMPRGR